jgi:hypothetical protein
MATIFRAETRHAGASGRYRFKTASFVICVIVSALSIGVHAERTATRTWQAKSGLQSVFNRHLVRVTIFEAGAPTVASHAVIELRDRANRLVARKEGALSPTLQLDLRVADNAGLIQLRAILTVVSDSDQFTAPLVTFEDINPDLGVVIKVDPPCGPGSGPADPQAMCPGWLVLTSPE